MHIARQLYITFIDDTSKEADAYFPKIKKEEWKETGREDHLTDENISTRIVLLIIAA